MAEKENCSLFDHGPVDHPVCPSAYLVHGFAVDYGMAPHRPIRRVFSDIRGPSPFEAAIIPLHQILACAAIPISGDLHCLPGAAERTGEDYRELMTSEHLTESFGLASAQLRQGDVGASGVLSRRAPFGLAVANQDEPGSVKLPVSHLVASS